MDARVCEDGQQWAAAVTRVLTVSSLPTPTQKLDWSVDEDGRAELALRWFGVLPTCELVIWRTYAKGQVSVRAFTTVLGPEFGHGWTSLDTTPESVCEFIRELVNETCN
jgi:hypothetical protein